MYRIPFAGLHASKLSTASEPFVFVSAALKKKKNIGFSLAPPRVRNYASEGENLVHITYEFLLERVPPIPPKPRHGRGKAPIFFLRFPKQPKELPSGPPKSKIVMEKKMHARSQPDQKPHTWADIGERTYRKHKNEKHPKTYKRCWTDHRFPLQFMI